MKWLIPLLMAAAAAAQQQNPQGSGPSSRTPRRDDGCPPNTHRFWQSRNSWDPYDGCLTAGQAYTLGYDTSVFRTQQPQTNNTRPGQSTLGGWRDPVPLQPTQFGSYGQNNDQLYQQWYQQMYGGGSQTQSPAYQGMPQPVYAPQPVSSPQPGWQGQGWQDQPASAPQPSWQPPPVRQPVQTNRTTQRRPSQSPRYR